MRVFLIAAVLGILANPTFANAINCDKVKDIAEQEALYAESLMNTAQTMPAGRNWHNSTQKQKDDFSEMIKAYREVWKRVAMYANIYQAFCKD